MGFDISDQSEEPSRVSEYVDAVPTWRVIIDAWREAMIAKDTNIPLLAMAVDIAWAQRAIQRWGMSQIAKNMRRDTLDILAGASDIFGVGDA